METPEDHWSRFADAARQSSELSSEPAQRPTREEVLLRLNALSGTLREMFLAILWRRWAMVAVILAVLAYIAAYLLFAVDPANSSERPQIPLPFPP